jgi:NAD-dependent SIR2 family protein deacetylase
VSESSLTTLYCGKCRALVPKRDIVYDRKTKTYVCRDCGEGDRA